MTTVIGFTGHAQHGKNTAAEYLATLLPDAKCYALADALREFVAKQNPYVAFRGGAMRRYNDLVEELGYEEAKALPECDVRRLLQATGTEAGRDIFGPDVWVSALDYRIGQDDPAYALVTDVRFLNEYEWAEESGFVVGVTRQNLDGTAYRAAGVDYEHASERSVDMLVRAADYRIAASSVTALKERVNEIAEQERNAYSQKVRTV